MSPVWDDPRVARGMERQLELRRDRIEAGERPVGWKVAFGAPQAMANLGIEAPLVGFITDRTQLHPGATVAIGDWTKGALEPEIAVHMGSDLPAGSHRAATAAAIAGLGPAIEVADLDWSLDDLEGVMARDIFHRGFILGPADAAWAGGSVDGLVARIAVDGAPHAETDDPTAMVGQMLDVVRHVADFVAAFGEGLRAGDVIITGSVVPLMWLDGDATIDYELEPIGALSIRIAG